MGDSNEIVGRNVYSLGSGGGPMSFDKGGGGGDDGDDMQARLRVVENAIARIDSMLPTLATKADLHEAMNGQIK